MDIIRLTHADIWESMGKPCSCMHLKKNNIFFAESPYQYRSHARIHINTKGTAVCFKARILLVPLGFSLGFNRVKLHVEHCYGNGTYAYILV